MATVNDKDVLMNRAAVRQLWVPGAARSNGQVRTGKETTQFWNRNSGGMWLTSAVQSGFEAGTYRYQAQGVTASLVCSVITVSNSKGSLRGSFKNVSRCMYGCCYAIFMKTIFTRPYLLSRLKNARSYTSEPHTSSCRGP